MPKKNADKKNEKKDSSTSAFEVYRWNIEYSLLFPLFPICIVDNLVYVQLIILAI
jgi:hypothetical protein